VHYKTLKKGSTTWSDKMVAGSLKQTPTSLALYSNPDQSSNQVMLLVRDKSDHLNALPWDGSRFTSLTELESNLGSNTKKPFSFFWNPVMTLI
jgi:hypothetical protein